MSNSILVRINPILFAIIAAATSHNLFFVLLPMQLRDAGNDASSIGNAMSVFSVGAILAGLFGSRAVMRVGHIRAFAAMAATLAIVAVLHSYSRDIWVTGLLRMVAGFCFVTGFITLESWLNVLSDQSNRGRVFSIYQICFALGFGSAPFLLYLFHQDDPRLFGIVSALLCVSLIIMAMCRLPAPELPARSRPVSLPTLWSYSPSATVCCFGAGLVGSATVSLISLYAYDRGLVGFALSIILGSYLLGGLLTQFPTGWLADRLDKRTVAVGLLVLGICANALIITDYFTGLPLLPLVLLFLFSGGAGAALFPLAVTQVFDHIEPEQAMSVTSTMQIILGVSGVLGPIFAGYLMYQFSAVWLYFFLVAVQLGVAAFLLVRKLVIRKEKLKPMAPYQIATQPTSLGASNLDPHIEYRQPEFAVPELKLLIAALDQDPRDPQVLIETALEDSTLTPADAATHLVLALPKQSETLMKCLVTLYPEQRMEIAQSLHDLFALHKVRINALIEAGLTYQASEEEIRQIHALIHSASEAAG